MVCNLSSLLIKQLIRGAEELTEEHGHLNDPNLSSLPWPLSRFSPSSPCRDFLCLLCGHLDPLVVLVGEEQEWAWELRPWPVLHLSVK